MSPKRSLTWLPVVLTCLIPVSCMDGGDGGTGLLAPEPLRSLQGQGGRKATLCESGIAWDADAAGVEDDRTLATAWRAEKDDDDDRDDDERDDDDRDDDGGCIDTSALAEYVGGAPVTPEMTRERIGPEGGSVRLGDFEIVVPAGAVSRPTTFIIRRPVDRHNRHKVVAELRPHNTTFAVPVRVRFPYEDTTLEGDPDGTVLLWSKKAKDWLSVPSALIEGGERIEAEVSHLSYWGTGRHRDADLTSGGR